MGKYLSLFAGFALLGVGQVQAAFIYGTFGINGSVRVTATSFDWAPPLGGGNGTVTIGALGNSGYFVALTGTALINDLIDPEATPGNPVSPFLNAFSGVGFGSFAVNQALFIAPAVATPVCTLAGIAVGTNCRLQNSTLTQTTIGSVTVSTNFNVLFEDGVNDPTQATGSFTTQLDGANGTVTAILQALGAPGGFIDSTFSGTFSSVPEPGTYGLMGAALGALLLRARTRR